MGTFRNDLTTGHKAEKLVVKYLNKNTANRAVHLDYEREIADIFWNEKYIEVKSVMGNYEQFCAETFAIHDGKEKVPQYLTHRGQIDLIVYVAFDEKRMYLYDAKLFTEWVLKNKDKEFIIGQGTAKVIKFPKKGAEVGYIKGGFCGC